MDPMRTLSPARIAKYTRRPRFVKARKSTGLDKSPGVAYVPGYASRGKCGAVHSIIQILLPSPTEGGIVQNMPSEARVLFMGPLDFLRGNTRVPDYFAENTGRPNKLGNQPQDNCMLLRRSQRMIPSSKGLGFSK